MYISKFFAAIALGLCLNQSSYSTTIETFEDDPAANGRFIQSTAFTESSFTWNPATRDLTAVTDNDSTPAYYLSNKFDTITDADNAFFRFDFRVTDIDDQEDGYAHLGLMTTQHINSFGDGLVVTLAGTDSGTTLTGRARVDADAFLDSGSGVSLNLDTDYRVQGTYDANTRQLSVGFLSGPGFTLLVGSSVATLDLGRNLSVNRIGLQNQEPVVDRTIGAITLNVDNISTQPIPEPSTAIIGLTALVGYTSIGGKRLISRH